MREQAIEFTRSSGVLPSIKLQQEENLLPYVQAMYEAGARVVEVTMTTPGALNAFSAIASHFGDKVLAAAGTVLTASAAHAAILAGARVIVSPAVVPEVIETAKTYGVACYAGAFTATECLAALRCGADMVKIFPAALGGPRYMLNLRMVFPQIRLIPSGGITPETAGEFIRCGADAISGARNFMDRQMVERHGLKWITERIAAYIAIVAQARAEQPSR